MLMWHVINKWITRTNTYTYKHTCVQTKASKNSTHNVEGLKHFVNVYATHKRYRLYISSVAMLPVNNYGLHLFLFNHLYICTTWCGMMPRCAKANNCQKHHTLNPPPPQKKKKKEEEEEEEIKRQLM